MQQKSFEETLNEKVNEFHLQARPGMWHAIEQELKPEKKRLALVWWGGAIAVSILIIGAIYWSGSFNSNKVLNPTIAHNNTATLPPSSTTPDQPLNQNKNQASNEKVTTVLESVSEPTDIKKSSLSFSQKSISKQFNNSAVNRMPTHQEPYNFENSIAVPRSKTTIESPAILNSEREPLEVERTPMVSQVELETEVAETPKPNKDTSIKATTYHCKASAELPWKFYIGANLLPTVSKSLLTENSSYGISPSNMGSDFAFRQTTDKSIVRMGAGLSVGIHHGAHQFYTGLSMYQIGFKQYVKNIERMVNTGNPISTANIRYYATDSFESAAHTGTGELVRNKFTYLALPLGYQYRVLSNGKFSLALNAELSAAVLLKSNTLFYDETTGYYVRQSALSFNPVKKIDGFVSAGIEFNYKLNSQWALSLRPQVGTTINAFQLGAVNTRFQFLKLGVGLQYKLF